MFTDAREKLRAFAPSRNVVAQDRWTKLPLNYVPGCIDRLFAVVGMFARHALSPPADSLRLDFNEKNAPLGGAAEAGLKEAHKRHADLAQDDGFDFHGCSSHRPS